MNDTKSYAVLLVVSEITLPTKTVGYNKCRQVQAPSHFLHVSGDNDAIAETITVAWVNMTHQIPQITQYFGVSTI